MKKFLTLLLSGFLCFNSFSVPVLAEETEKPDEEQVTESVSEESEEQGDEVVSGETEDPTTVEDPDEVTEEPEQQTVSEETLEPTEIITETGEADTEVSEEPAEQTITILFDANAEDAIGTIEPFSVVTGKDYQLPENTFEREGYEFVFWNTKSDGSGII